VGERNYKWVLPAEDRLVLINEMPPRSIPPEEGRSWRTKFTYLVHPLSRNCKLIGDSLKLPSLDAPLERALLIDGHLLLSTASATIAIPLPAP
jgi:hypothetical protein